MEPDRDTHGADEARVWELYKQYEREAEERARAEANLTEEEWTEKVLDAERELLREHIGLPRKPSDPAPELPTTNVAGFFIERATDAAECELPTCWEIIPQGDYQLALAPAMNLTHWTQGQPESVDLYHIRCFEEIADFSDSAFLDRVYPVTRNTYPLKGTGHTSEDCLLDAGAESLVTAWSISRDRLIDERDAIHREIDQVSKDFADLVLKAGTPGFQAPEPEGMTSHEHRCRVGYLAPVESDGPEDTEPWSLHEEYLDDSPDSLNNKHDLSEMLELWGIHCRILHSDVDTPEMRELVQKLKDQLGPKGIRAVERMSTVLMPGLQADKLF